VGNPYGHPRSYLAGAIRCQGRSVQLLNRTDGCSPGQTVTCQTLRRKRSVFAIPALALQGIVSICALWALRPCHSRPLIRVPHPLAATTTDLRGTLAEFQKPFSQLRFDGSAMELHRNLSCLLCRHGNRQCPSSDSRIHMHL